VPFRRWEKKKYKGYFARPPLTERVLNNIYEIKAEKITFRYINNLLNKDIADAQLLF